MVAAGISHFLTHRYKISLSFFQRNWSPFFFFFFSRYSSFSVIQVNVVVVVVVVVVVFSLSKTPGSHAIYRRNARVLEMQNFIPD